MAVRKFKPVTPGQRHKIIGTFDEITTSTPEKSLLSPKKSTGGRNNTGKMTVRYIGGGHKQMYRNVDFKRQKGTGGARCGSIKSPLFPGGGRVFGPVPRDYSFKLNKKLKQLARRSALTYKAQAGAIQVLENPAMEAPKTKAIVALTKALNVENKKVLVVLPETNVNFQLSCRNIPSVKPILAQNLNTYEVMNASAVVLVEGAENVINVMLA